MRIFCLCILLIPSLAKGQESVSPNFKAHYFFSFSSGAVLGEPSGKSVTFSGSMVHGAAIGQKFRAGLGVGFDSYANCQTMPLFGQVSYDVFGKGNALFVQFNYGWSHAWNTSTDQWWSMEMTGGKMVNPMVGYRIRSGDLSITISAGYKYQRVVNEERFFYPWWDGNTTLSAGTVRETEQIFERVVFSFGFGWK